jgi:hypothetical protein
LVASAFDDEGTLAAVAQALVVGGVTVGVFSALLALVARRQLREAVAVLSRRSVGTQR